MSADVEVMGITDATIEAAKALLEARDNLIAADAAAFDARRLYAVAEGTYTKTFVEGHPKNLLAGSVLIMARDEWYDLNEGERLEFHTVEKLR